VTAWAAPLAPVATEAESAYPHPQPSGDGTTSPLRVLLKFTDFQSPSAKVMQLLLGILGGLGIGSLLTQIATHFMARRASASDRLYQEKREAYLG
jgi:hypothetical protein